jgi:hypothetical protein
LYDGLTARQEIKTGDNFLGLKNVITKNEDVKKYKQIITSIAVGLALVGCIKCYDLPAACELEPDAGPCEALFERYYFDQETGECTMFHWGGCDGVVPFETLEECQICVEGK